MGLSGPAAAGRVDQVVPVPEVLGDEEWGGGEGTGGMAMGNGGGRPYGIGRAAVYATTALPGRRGRGPPAGRFCCGTALWRRTLPGGTAGLGGRRYSCRARWGVGQNVAVGPARVACWGRHAPAVGAA